jgi:6-phosphogluconate dehydrogenase
MVGLGRMGSNMVRRLMRDGHACVVHDLNPDAVATLASEGATGTASIADLVAARDANDFADRVLSAMRKGFGRHEELKA